MASKTLIEWTAADFRAERARQRIPLFQLAAHVGAHPALLGQVLNEKRIMTPRMAVRIAAGLGLLREIRE